jgi:hypothetical protein
MLAAIYLGVKWCLHVRAGAPAQAFPQALAAF